MKIVRLAVLASVLFTTQGYASTGTATVILLKGKALVAVGGKTKELSLKDTVPQGATIKTEARSFVKLAFQDNSQMNIGPESQLKIEATPAGEPGVVNLISGQLRAKVTKDLMKVDTNEPKDKLYIKTKTAAMGIRGTDFQTIYNPANQLTSLVTFEGAVAMAKIDNAQNFQASLSSSQTVTVGPGQYSGTSPDMALASVPVKISPAQVSVLQANDTMQGVGEKAQQKTEVVGSNVPPGVDPKTFAGSDAGMMSALSATVGTETLAAATSRAEASNAPPPEGFFNANTGEYAPRAGGFIDLNSGIYVPPPPGSSFDANTGVFVPPKALGGFDPATGNYVPPKGMDLDPQKGFVPTPGATTTGTSTAAALILNQVMAPQNAGVTTTFVAAFSPTTTSLPPPPPPPPGTETTTYIAQPDAPISDPYCPTCRDDNILAPAPVITPLQFSITVGP